MVQELKDEDGEVFYKVYYKPEEKTVCSHWYGDYLGVENVKKGALLGLSVFKNHPESKVLLNDNSELRGVWDDANEWIANEWIPAAIEAGLLRFAHIISKEMFAQLSAEMMADNAKERSTDSFEMKLFDNFEEARAWLAEVA